MQIIHGPRVARTETSGAKPLIECAQCGEPLYMPEWSECMDRDRIRHLWACDSCGYAFETIVRFATESQTAAA
jgi:uncharacterized Zn finger protein